MKIGGYEFAEGARFQSGATGDAKIIGEYLDLLRQQFKGELTPKDVVDDARNPNSPLHSFFEWNDGDAAEQYRLQQARGLIRSVVAIYIREEEPAVRTKAFIHIPEASAPHYRSADDAMRTKKTRDMILQRALAELIGWQKKYKDLVEFADLFEEIKQTKSKLAQKAKH